MGLRGLLTQEAVLGVFGMTPDDIPNQLLLFTQILTDTAFAFLPALVCWSTFKNFGGSPVIGIVLGLMLVSNSLPSAYDVGSGAAEPLVFFGFIKVAGYQGSVLPAFATGVLTAKFEKWLRERVPDAIDLIVTPFVTLVVGIVLALFVLGPILHTVENVVLYAVEGLLTLPFGIGGLLYGGSGQLLGIFGIHHILNFLEISMLANDGWNYLNPIGTCGNVAQAGAVLAVAIKALSAKTKQVAYPSCLSALLGNFSAAVEKDTFGQVRAQIGLNPDTFTWTLKPGETFDTPEAVLNYSTNGLNGMRQGFHKLIRNHIMPPRWRDAQRPVLLNSWEAMYYDVSLDKIETQAQLAKELGIELFVLEDGWFRAGNDSRSSMGDWTCNQNKLPGGIDRVASIVHAKGLKFGLWFEPEAVSPNSQLYRTHPDWIVHVPGYTPVEGRHEYLLDLGRTEVRKYLLDMLHDYLAGGQIDYIKWDMNRPLTDVVSSALPPERQGEAAHRYILGLYAVLDEITRCTPMCCSRAARAAVRALMRVCCTISRRTGQATTPMPATASPFSRGSICSTRSPLWAHMSASPPTIRPAAPLRSTRGIRYAGCTIWATNWA